MVRKINIDHVTKIEGHARLHIKIDNGGVKKVKLNIFEGSRFFEGILKTKHFHDVNHIASRICGICSPVHGLTSVKATEKAMNVIVSEQTELLRELLNIGGTIQSHVVHLFFLTLPDYTGHPNAVQMAQTHPHHIKKALKIKQFGNEVVNVIGGRSIHPYTVCPGGFTRIPTRDQFKKLLKSAKSCLSDAKNAAEIFCGLKYPDFERKTKHFALKGKCYFCPEDVISCAGDKECISVPDYEAHFKEFFKQGSTAEFAKKDEKSYMVGAWSRILNNYNLLSKESKELTRCILPRKFSPFMNNPAQAVEIFEGTKRIIEVLESADFKDEKPAEIKPKQGTGIGANEAPRGIVFHKYKYDSKGITNFVNITTPTTQNLPNLEEDIKNFLPLILNKSKQEIQLEIEKLIRAYDPCISCATHFLQIVWD
ncbi:Ni/Fe hydrogenase subunit alpha [Candidatus Woesearchaeota archaeon]|nr:Ni/Fe hydrogenase subunit alpha [Candidatus Woesearchaeota archaeon]